MNIIEKYITSMFPYILISFPIYIILRYIIIKIKKDKISLKHEVFLLIFIMFLIGLFSQAFIPKNKYHETNLIPFKIIYDTYRETFIKGNINYLIISFLGNIIMFIPIGLLISLLWNKSNKNTILIGFSISLFIEIVQLFLKRCTDIDDLILNTLGVYLGILIYKIIFKKKKESSS